MNTMKRNITLILTLLFLISNSNLLKSQWFPKWVEINYPNGFAPSGGGEAYLDVWYLKSNPNYVWICGHKSRILRSTDGGLTWKGSVVERNGIYQLESITFVSEKVGYASGAGKIFRSDDGGETWSDIAPNKSSEIWGNYFTDENNGMVIGGGCGSFQEFYRTTNGGLSWQRQLTDFPESKMSDVLIYPNPLGNAIAIGSGWLWASKSGFGDWAPVSKTQSGASDWQEELASNKNTILVPYATGCTGSTDNSGGIRISTDFGKTWRDFFTGKAMFGTYLTSPTTGWAAGFGNSVYYTCDAGKSWTLLNCGIENADLDDLSFPNDTTGIVVGTKVYQLTNSIRQPNITIDSVFICEGEVATLKPDSTQNNVRFSYCGYESEIKVNDSGEFYSYSSNDSKNVCDITDIKKYVVTKLPKPDITFGVDPKTPPCDGDTVTIYSIANNAKLLWNTGDTTRSIQVTKSGNYVLNVIGINGCTNSSTYSITFNPLPDPKIDGIPDIPCFGNNIILNANSDFAKIEWFNQTSGETLGEGRNKAINKDGKYFFKATNQFGCSKYSDTLFVEFRIDSNVFDISMLDTDNTLNFDTLFNYESSCKTFKMRNISSKPYTINNLYLARNVGFTMPKSKFPFTIPPMDSLNVEICFSPIKLGLDYDTLLLEDNCSLHSLNMKVLTKGAKTLGKSRCEVPWSLEIISLGKTPFIRYSEISPNPNKGQFNFSLMTYSLESKPKVALYGAMGNKIKDLEIDLINSENEGELKTYFGECFIENLGTDIYYMHIESDLESNIIPVVVVK